MLKIPSILTRSANGRAFWPTIGSLKGLKALKVHLKKWNEEILGNVGKRKKDFMDGIRELDVMWKENFD